MHLQRSKPKEHIYFIHSIVKQFFSTTLLNFIVTLVCVYRSKMAAFWKIIAALLLISIAEAKPLDVENADESELVTDGKVNESSPLLEEQVPNLYLIFADTAEPSEDAEVDSPIQKRSTEEVDDLETAAGTNVLRPLFVYRQQLAYRERVKKGAVRRPGIRPRF